MEDFNILLLNEQVELIRAQCAKTQAERVQHCREAESFGRQIEDHAFPYRSVAQNGRRLFDAHSYDDLLTTH
ncbi:hypothetical protein [Croceicoccus gelatinilyticus]|uniref:hypothetical protein n=1 Tax=Croceicoccus gelatinilyticus TaxID=2835536 RepID=UPI001BD0487C|nr:hypothetical protein [Croceicoccus gelatinilyticus]MBS7670282.1 hypothetical protein [Croceicoccus gelatinilyticus]